MARMAGAVLLGAVVILLVAPAVEQLGRLVVGPSFHSRDGETVSTAFVLVVSLPTQFFAAVLGGFAAAFFARQEKPRAVRILVGLAVVLGIAWALAASRLVPQDPPRVPAWSLFARPVVHVVGIVFGAGRVRFLPLTKTSETR